MSEYTILEHCSPTLAGIKTGNLVTCGYRTREEVRSDLRRWNRVLMRKGLRIIPLKYMEEKVLLYIYRPAVLRRDLAEPKRAAILKSCGYGSTAVSDCICTLIRRLRSGDGFPHEIGVFIGYPPEDVEGFIQKHGADYKCAGPWKVYGDVESTLRLFEKYRHCTEVYTRLGRSGRTMEQLAVRCAS